MLPHPGDQAHELRTLPGGSGQGLLGDPPGVSLAALEVLVDPQPRRPAHLQGERREALVLDEVAEHPLLHGEELVRAVGGLTEAHHLGVTDHRAERPEIGGAGAGLGGAQRVGGTLDGPYDGGLPCALGAAGRRARATRRGRARPG
ncbi:hypothetical protein ABZ366_27130, partial [Streptomyces sp. NPDC005904]|uniref:hypothetical protein n=1 Tax=Streptomyces sp. NPDC005904 TaxID=3154570 RepID=UPI0033CE1D6F